MCLCKRNKSSKKSKSPYAFDLVPMPTGKKKGKFKAGYDLYPTDPLKNF